LESHSILDPLWADPTYCAAGDSPLACEYKIHRPAIALIMVRPATYGNGPGSQFDLDLRDIVKYSVQHGVIPVLSTLAFQGGAHPNPEEINATIRQVALDEQVPLWDFWQTTETLPERGVDTTFHLTLPPDDTKTLYFFGEYMQYGMTHRNLEALQALHEILNKVMR
jgi:hypothetical protein